METSDREMSAMKGFSWKATQADFGQIYMKELI